MVLRVILFIILLLVFAGTAWWYNRRRQMGIDLMNVYRLRMDGVPVFTRLQKFLRIYGIPPEVRIRRESYPIHSEDEFYTLLDRACKDGDEFDLHYEGFVMNYFRDTRLIITSIDFRKTELGLDYGDWRFDRSFTFGDFEALFPISAGMDVHRTTGIQSCFEINTGESAFDKETYMVQRWSKDNLLAGPTVEFTFEDGRLIYMFFANF